MGGTSPSVYLSQCSRARTRSKRICINIYNLIHLKLFLYMATDLMWWWLGGWGPGEATGPGLKGALLSREFSLEWRPPGDLVPMGPGVQKEAGRLRILSGTCSGLLAAWPPGGSWLRATANSLSSSLLLSSLTCTITCWVSEGYSRSSQQTYFIYILF